MSLLSKLKSFLARPKNDNPNMEPPILPDDNGPQKRSFSRLRVEGENYSVTERTTYHEDGRLKPQTIDRVFDFAYKMAFTAEGQHRRNRSGGSRKRRNGEIFANTFQGKIAECAACNYLYKYDGSVQPDFSVSRLGTWDSVDISACGKEISIKSTKHFGQLLLLETADWDSQGNYIPNKGKGVSSYDYIFLIRLKPSCEDILKEHRLLYADYVNREELYRLLASCNWTYNFVGYLTKEDLLQIINDGYILPKGTKLNGKTTMDAENYYVQAGDLRDMASYGALLQ